MLLLYGYLANDCCSNIDYFMPLERGMRKQVSFAEMNGLSQMSS